MTIQRDITAELLENLAKRFHFHGSQIYGRPNGENSSPLYAHLALALSNDPEILALVAQADLATQVSNLLFGAVQFLLLSGIEHPLRNYYPNLTKQPKEIHDAYPVFRAFCLQHAAAIQELVTTQRVQTNEVGRCTALVPAFSILAERNSNAPLALIEIGASAGLLLHWDSYAYHYESLGSFGDSSLELMSELRGKKKPILPKTFPQVAERIGLELNPIDIHNDTNVRWLKALIWPEHRDRQQLLEAALKIAQTKELLMIGGNAADNLLAALENIAETNTLCIFHSYTFAQMPRSIQDDISQQLLEYSKQRKLYRISQEWLAGWEKPRIELFSYHNGEMQSEFLAYAESHGRWLEWLM